MADKAWAGNVGEWGEIYAACALLGAGQLSIAERPKPYQLLDLQRPEKQGSSRYTVEGTDVRTGSNRGLIPRSEYTDAADLIRRSITRRTAGARTFSLAPEIQAQIERLGFSKISAGSAVNSDVNLEVLAPNEIDRIQLKGFSIKTEAGSAPTFYNMSGRSGRAEGVCEKIECRRTRQKRSHDRVCKVKSSHSTWHHRISTYLSFR